MIKAAVHGEIEGIIFLFRTKKLKHGRIIKADVNGDIN